MRAERLRNVNTISGFTGIHTWVPVMPRVSFLSFLLSSFFFLLSFFLSFFLSFYFFSFLFSIGRVQAGEKSRGRETERESQAGSRSSTELDAGLDLPTLGS